jgi:hypothetical protein
LRPSSQTVVSFTPSEFRVLTHQLRQLRQRWPGPWQLPLLYAAYWSTRCTVVRCHCPLSKLSLLVAQEQQAGSSSNWSVAVAAAGELAASARLAAQPSPAQQQSGQLKPDDITVTTQQSDHQKHTGRQQQGPVAATDQTGTAAAAPVAATGSKEQPKQTQELQGYTHDDWYDQHKRGGSSTGRGSDYVQQVGQTVPTPCSK